MHALALAVRDGPVKRPGTLSGDVTESDDPRRRIQAGPKGPAVSSTAGSLASEEVKILPEL